MRISYIFHDRDWSHINANHYRIQTYLEPLAVAANVTQASDTRLDHVLLMLASLYQTFSAPTVERPVRDKVIASLERRWKKADQGVSILAVFFNPFIRGYCFNREALGPLALLAIARRTYKRFYNVDTDNEFMKGILDYSSGQHEFTAEAMELDGFLEEAKHRNAVSSGARSGISAGVIQLLTMPRQSVNIKQIWEFLNHSKDGPPPPGRTGVARMAVRILSIVANSGDSERVFSEFGATHTDRRSRLSPAKVHKSTQVKMHLNRCHAAATRELNARKKRKFGTDVPAVVNTAPGVAAGAVAPPAPPLPPGTPMSHPTVADQHPSLSPHSHAASTLLDGDFETLAQQLISDARDEAWEDHLDEDLEPEPEPSAEPPSEPRLHPNALVFPANPTPQLLEQSGGPVAPFTHTTRKTNIPLSRLFTYREDLAHGTLETNGAEGRATGIPSTARIDFFWADGVRELVREAQLHDMVEADSEAATHA